MSDEKKLALVTGATRGIGMAIAIKLGQAGHTVIGTATSEKGAQAISDYLKANQIDGQGFVLNVADNDSIDALMAQLKSDYSMPDILVNNAGITRDNLLMRMKDDEWDAIMQTNLTSIYKLSKACLRSMMKSRWGRIISIASVVGLTGNPGQTNYSAAKAGILGFTKSLAREVGSRNITVNAVAPGFIATDMTKELPEEVKESLLKQIPLERLGEPDEIASAVAFLSSMDANYITGETINVNGGMYMP
ncbi:MAG: 3-oxoacyl-ACP reductase FabG [Gammaproteobacteria bacterium]|nr:3-oxoacyl-ACP reductase FabG [Gammaproteobacteria bacterium]